MGQIKDGDWEKEEVACVCPECKHEFTTEVTIEADVEVNYKLS